MSETESNDASPDPRTAEVLRVVQRAKGVVKAELVPSLQPPPDLADGLVMLHEALSNRNVGLQDGVESLVATVRGLEGLLVTSTEKAAEFHRGQDRNLRELRDSVQDLKHRRSAATRPSRSIGATRSLPRGTSLTGCGRSPPSRAGRLAPHVRDK